MSALFDTAVAAVRHIERVHNSTGELGALADAEQAAKPPVTDAVTGGIPHDVIANAAGVHGLHVAQLVTDDETRAVALCRERFLAGHYLADVRDAMREEALWWLDCGVEKRYTATTFGVSRPTLDAWWREKADAADDQDVQNTAVSPVEEAP